MEVLVLVVCMGFSVVMVGAVVLIELRKENK